MSHSVSQSSDDPFELCGVGADEGAEGDFADADRLHGHRARLGLHHLLNLSKLQRGDSPRALRFIGKVLKVALCRGFEPRRGTTSQFSIFF